MNVRMVLGGIKAPVIFAGPAPGFAGLSQFKVQSPANASGVYCIVPVKVCNG